LSEFPRVLFLTSAAFNTITGGGVTFTNLFRGWPTDQIATVHNDSIPPSMEICTKYFRLGPDEIHKRGLLSLIRWPSQGDSPPTPSPSGPVGQRKRNRVRDFMVAVKKLLFGNAVPDVGCLTPELEAWVEAYRPEVLYTILGSISMMELALSLRKRFGTSLVVHLMDDWPAISYRGGVFSAASRRRMHRLLDEIMRVADVRMGICDAMVIEYQKRYGRPFVAFQNAIDSQKWLAYSRTDVATAHPLRLLYIGSILPEAQLDSLADCCAAVAQLHQGGDDIRLDIYSANCQMQWCSDRLRDHAGVVLHDAITDDEGVFRQLSSADILLLPVNFDEASVRYIRYSMPTKVPAYLFSGTPVLVYGSEKTAQVSYARDKGWGHVVSAQGSVHVAAGIRALARDAGLRTRLSATARKLASANHDASQVRVKFQLAIRESASHPGRHGMHTQDDIPWSRGEES